MRSLKSKLVVSKTLTNSECLTGRVGSASHRFAIQPTETDALFILFFYPKISPQHYLSLSSGFDLCDIISVGVTERLAGVSSGTMDQRMNWTLKKT